MSATGNVISEMYREQNKLMHEQLPAYGVSAASRWGEHIIELVRERKYETVLDYGCGKSSMGEYLRGRDIVCRDYDPAFEDKCMPPLPADLVVCTDVLEHIEPEYIDNVMKDLVRVTKGLAFLVISNQQAKKTLPDGRNAHLLVRDPAWWINKVREHFNIHGVKVNLEGQTETLLHVRTK